MKRVGFVMVIVCMAIAAVSAQTPPNPWGQTVTVDGILQLQNGSIALASGNSVYFVPMLTRYVGFIDGLKEGARVSVQGYVGGYNMLMPTAITVNGKAYDLGGNSWGGGYGMGHHGGGYGGGWGHRGGCYWQIIVTKAEMYAQVISLGHTFLFLIKGLASFFLPPFV
jgi:hypothetical protein